MQKTYFRNNKSINKNAKKFTQITKVDAKDVVDINILLNRIKLEEKNAIKRKIIFYSFTTLALSLFGTFIVIIK